MAYEDGRNDKNRVDFKKFVCQKSRLLCFLKEKFLDKILIIF